MQDGPPHSLNIAWFHQKSRLTVFKVDFCTGGAGRHNGLTKTHRLKQAAVTAGESDGLQWNQVKLDSYRSGPGKKPSSGEFGHNTLRRQSMALWIPV